MTESELIEKAKEIRIETLDMILEAGSGHIGGSFSAIEILVSLYYSVMKLSKDEKSLDRDRFVLSKGHANPPLYAILMDLGYLDKNNKHTLRKFGSPLQGHPDSAKCFGLDSSTGSLGQGISVATGMAMSIKMQGGKGRVFVLAGDGELDEGICYEAFMSACNYNLDNLVIVVDRNRLQLSGETESVMKLGSLKAKAKAFGFDTDEVDGHDFTSLIPSLNKEESSKPHFIIANTIKGKGVSFMENDPYWHGGMPKGEQIEKAYEELRRGLK